MFQTISPTHSLQNWCRPEIPLHLYNLQFPPHTSVYQYEPNDTLPIFSWNLSAPHLTQTYRNLVRALHPDKNHHAPLHHQLKCEHATRLILNAYEILSSLTSTHIDSNPKDATDLAAQSYISWCWYWEYTDSRFLRRGTHSICDVRPYTLLSWSDWVIELLHLQTDSYSSSPSSLLQNKRKHQHKNDQWLNQLSKSLNPTWNWGWGYEYEYDERGNSTSTGTVRIKRTWAGPPNIRLSFLDGCKEIELLLPRRLYQREQSMWRLSLDSVMWEVRAWWKEWGFEMGEGWELMQFYFWWVFLGGVGSWVWARVCGWRWGWRGERRRRGRRIHRCAGFDSSKWKSIPSSTSLQETKPKSIPSSTSPQEIKPKSESKSETETKLESEWESEQELQLQLQLKTELDLELDLDSVSASSSLSSSSLSLFTDVSDKEDDV